MNDSIRKAVLEYFDIPDNIKELSSDAGYDLRYGPLYLDEDGEKCTCFEEGSKRFNFSDAIEQISFWLQDLIPDRFYYDSQSGNCFKSSKPIEDDWIEDEDGEPILVNDPSDCCELDYKDVACCLFGKELSSYL